MDAVKFMFEYFMKRAELLPQLYRDIAELEGIERAVVDYISSMSDTYAVNIFRELTLPKAWNL